MEADLGTARVGADRLDDDRIDGDPFGAGRLFWLAVFRAVSGLAFGLLTGTVVALIVHAFRPDLVQGYGALFPLLFVGLFGTTVPLLWAAAVAHGPRRIARLRHAVATAPAEGRLLPARIDSIAERPGPLGSSTIRLVIGLSVAPPRGEPWATVVSPVLPVAQARRFAIGDVVAVARLVDGHPDVMIAEGAGTRPTMRDAAHLVAALPPRDRLVVRGAGRLSLEAQAEMAKRTPPVRGGFARFLLASLCTLIGVGLVLVPLRADLAAAVTATTATGVAVTSREQTDDYFDAAMLDSALDQIMREAGSTRVRGISVLSDGVCVVGEDGTVRSRGEEPHGSLCGIDSADAAPFDAAAIASGAVRQAVDAARENAGVVPGAYREGTFGPNVSVQVPAGATAPLISVDLTFEAPGDMFATYRSEVSGDAAVPLLGTGSAAAAIDEIVAATGIEQADQVTIADDALCVYADGTLVGSKLLGGSCSSPTGPDGDPFPLSAVAWERIAELTADARSRTNAIPYREQNLSAAYGPQVDVRVEDGALRIEIGMFFESQLITNTITYTVDGDFVSAWPPVELG